MFPSSGERKQTPTLMGAFQPVILSKGPNWVGVSIPSPEDEQIQFPKRFF
jgi:hypothetical protein